MRSVVLLLSLLGLTSVAQAFPEMIRLGYVNCTACHVSPSGGGLLTEYGRATSAEVLSTWSSPKEELAGHGVFPEPPAWLKVGGDLRALQTYVDSPRATATSFFPMQLDLEFGLTAGKFTYVQTLGVQGGPDGAPYRNEFIAHRYYALYNVTEETYVRAGKYFMPFGINLPDHTSLVRKNLGFNENQETYNLDMGTLKEGWSLNLSANFGRADQVGTKLDQGGALQAGFNVTDTGKILGSVAYLKNDNTHRYLAGPAVLWAFSPQWVFLGEYDYQEKTVEAPTKSVQKGVITYSRLQYEWKKGVNPYVLHQLSYTDFTQLRTRATSAGVGLLFYPRPHFEVALEFDNVLVADVNETTNAGWILLHYYL